MKQPVLTPNHSVLLLVCVLVASSGLSSARTVRRAADLKLMQSVDGDILMAKETIGELYTELYGTQGSIDDALDKSESDGIGFANFKHFDASGPVVASYTLKGTDRPWSSSKCARPCAETPKCSSWTFTGDTCYLKEAKNQNHVPQTHRGWEAGVLTASKFYKSLSHSLQAVDLHESTGPPPPMKGNFNLNLADGTLCDASTCKNPQCTCWEGNSECCSAAELEEHAKQYAAKTWTSTPRSWFRGTREGADAQEVLATLLNPDPSGAQYVPNAKRATPWPAAAIEILRGTIKPSFWAGTSPRFLDPEQFDLARCCNFDINVELWEEGDIFSSLGCSRNACAAVHRTFNFGRDSEKVPWSWVPKRSKLVEPVRKTSCLNLFPNHIWCEKKELEDDSAKCSGEGMVAMEVLLRQLPDWNGGKNWIVTDSNDWGSAAAINRKTHRTVGDSIVAFYNSDHAIVWKTSINRPNARGVCNPTVVLPRDAKCITPEDIGVKHVGYRKFFDVALPLVVDLEGADGHHTDTKNLPPHRQKSFWGREFLAYFAGGCTRACKPARSSLFKIHDPTRGIIAFQWFQMGSATEEEKAIDRAMMKKYPYEVMLGTSK